MILETDLLKHWIENLGKFETLQQLQESPFFKEAGDAIRKFLAAPLIVRNEGIEPRLRSHLRVAQWNIEKGKHLDALIDTIKGSGVLQWADVILLNEADWGMNRSGNRPAACEMADRLHMHMAFAPAYIELTKGIDEELLLDGENCESLQGNAVLSRYPILDARVVQLPVTFEPYEFHEKRYGARNCLWVRIQTPYAALWVGSTHFELRNSPRCRAAQMRHILKNLPGNEADAYLLGGDLNVNGFDRGTLLRTIRSIARVLWHKPEVMKERLLHPEWGGEPLFSELRRGGFSWDGLNSHEETARAALSGLEEAAFLPKMILDGVARRLAPYEGYFCFKLDWFFGKNIRALSAGEIKDPQTGVSSLAPGRIEGIHYGPNRISDHLPIYADIHLP